MTDRDPVTVGIRVDDRNVAHTRVSVFVGRNEDARGHAGHLVLRTDEWDDLMHALAGLRDLAETTLDRDFAGYVLALLPEIRRAGVENVPTGGLL